MPPRNAVAAQAELLVARIAAEVIAEEAARGLSVPSAIRPLFAHEIAATTRFGELEDAEDDAEKAIERITRPLWAALLARLMDDLNQHNDMTADVTERLGDLRSSVDRIEGTDDVIDTAASRIYFALLAVRSTWAQATLEEAKRQNVDPAVLPDVNRLVPTDVQRRVLLLRARQVAQHPLGRLIDVAHASVSRRNANEADALEVLETLREELVAVSQDGTADVARQAIHDAANEGRAQVVDEGPKPSAIYASEILDRNTCGPCRVADGREYESVADAMADYPGGGGYGACDGGRRCRGTLVYVWDETGPGVDDVPAPPTDPGPAPRMPDLQVGQVRKVLRGEDGRGGHLWTSPVLNKSKFPERWNEERVRTAVQDLLAEPTLWTEAVVGGRRQHLRVLVDDGVIVLGRWKYSTDSRPRFFSLFPLNGRGVAYRSSSGTTEERPFDPTALLDLGFSREQLTTVGLLP